MPSVLYNVLLQIECIEHGTSDVPRSLDVRGYIVRRRTCTVLTLHAEVVIERSGTCKRAALAGYLPP